MMFWNFAIHSCDSYNHGQYAQVTYTGETQTEIYESHIHASMHSCLLFLSLTHIHIYMHGHTHTSHTHTHTHFKITNTEHFHVKAFQVTELICWKTDDTFCLSNALLHGFLRWVNGASSTKSLKAKSKELYPLPPLLALTESV